MKWRISIDTGGTFTDAYAIDPGGELRRCKILSSGNLRIPVRSRSGTAVSVALPSQQPDGFFVGFKLDSHRVVGSRGDTLELEREIGSNQPAAEISSGEEAPVLAIRLLTGTALGEASRPSPCASAPPAAPTPCSKAVALRPRCSRPLGSATC